MKVNHILYLGAAMAVPQPALTGLQFTGEMLGTSQAIIDFCALVDPSAAATYQALVALMVQGVPAKELAEVRMTGEYKLAYQRVSAALGGVARPDASESCNHFLDTD